MNQRPDWFWERVHKLTHIQCQLNEEIIKFANLKSSGEFDNLGKDEKELLSDHFEYFKIHSKFMIRLINTEFKNDKPAA